MERDFIILLKRQRSNLIDATDAREILSTIHDKEGFLRAGSHKSNIRRKQARIAGDGAEAATQSLQ